MLIFSSPCYLETPETLKDIYQKLQRRLANSDILRRLKMCPLIFVLAFIAYRS